MKKVLSTLLAGAALAVAGQSAQAALGTLQVKLVPTLINQATGLFDVAVQVRAVGTGNAGQGDGGVSDFQFAITSDGHALSNAVAGTPSSKSKITWDSVVTTGGNFSTVTPARQDLGADGDSDVNGAFMFDSNNFRKTDLGTGGFQTIATVQFLMTAAGLAAGHDNLTLAPSNVQFYDYVNGVDPNFRNTFASIDASGATGVLIAVPEPASLGLLGLGVLGLAARRRQA